MNIFQKICKYFGCNYVVLQHFDGLQPTKRVKKLGGNYYACPYLDETKVRLLPKGKTEGREYIIGWLPVTREMTVHFHSGNS